MSDTDVWWHLRTGQLIIQTGTVPYVDWFTFVDFDRPWIDLHWGFQVLLAAVYALGGIDLVILWKALTYASVVAVAWSAAGPRMPASLKAAIWIPSVILITGRGMERPEMLSLLFLASWWWLLERAKSQNTCLWMLPLIQLAWVNCHALFVLGLFTGVAFAIDQLIRRCARGRFGLEIATAPPSFRTLLYVGGATCAACLVNPYGEEGVFFPLVLYRKFTVEQAFYSVRIGEFQSPLQLWHSHGLMNTFVLPLTAAWCLGVASFIGLAIQRRRWSPFRLLAFVAFTHLAWEASRNSSLFALISAIVTCLNLEDATKERDWLEKTRVWQKAAQLQFVVITGLILAVVIGGWNQLTGDENPFGFGERPGWYAHGASVFAGKPDMPSRAFVAHHGQAGVYIYHNAPERLVFMDARLEVSTQRTFELYEQVLSGMASGTEGEWVKTLRDPQGALPAVILDSRYSRSQINGLLRSGNWRLVFADSAAAVFLDVALADRLRLGVADPRPLLHPPGTRVQRGG